MTPKDHPGRKKVGRWSMGNEASGVNGKANTWEWMEKWEKHGKLK
jgi:hypothetical protein